MEAEINTLTSTRVTRGLTELMTLGRTLKRRAGDILAYFDHPHTSNGPTEAINGRIEDLRGSAPGLPKPHPLHHPLPPRNRRIQTPTTPPIMKSHLSRSQVNSWLDILRILRNICAHQGRLFNRTLRQVKLPEDAEILGIRELSPKKNKCFDQLTLVQYLTRTMGLGDGTALPSVLATFPATDVVPLRATGTPDNWQSLPLWAYEPTT